MTILTSITFLPLLTCITKEDNWAVTIIHVNAKSKLCQQDTVDEYKEWFYPTGKIGHKLLYITNIFGLCHVFHTQHGVIQQSNMRAGVIQVCLHTVSWVK